MVNDNSDSAIPLGAGSGTEKKDVAPERERISIDEAIRCGYMFVPVGWDHAKNCRIVAPIEFILPFSAGWLYKDVLDEIRESQTDQEPTGDIPLTR